MLTLLFVMGPRHPPTADDTVPLGAGRIVLGWLTLAFVLLSFTPQPFYGLVQYGQCGKPAAADLRPTVCCILPVR